MNKDFQLGKFPFLLFNLHNMIYKAIKNQLDF